MEWCCIGHVAFLQTLFCHQGCDYLLAYKNMESEAFEGQLVLSNVYSWQREIHGYILAINKINF